MCENACSTIQYLLLIFNVYLKNGHCPNSLNKSYILYNVHIYFQNVSWMQAFNFIFNNKWWSLIFCFLIPVLVCRDPEHVFSSLDHRGRHCQVCPIAAWRSDDAVFEKDKIISIYISSKACLTERSHLQFIALTIRDKFVHETLRLLILNFKFDFHLDVFLCLSSHTYNRAVSSVVVIRKSKHCVE